MFTNDILTYTSLNLWKNECRSYSTLIHTPLHMRNSIIQER